MKDFALQLTIVETAEVHSAGERQALHFQGVVSAYTKARQSLRVALQHLALERYLWVGSCQRNLWNSGLQIGHSHCWLDLDYMGLLPTLNFNKHRDTISI